MKRELNDHGGFDRAKPTEHSWRFWPRRKVEGAKASELAVVVTSGPSWMAARELAARHFASNGNPIAAQDLDSAPA